MSIRIKDLRSYVLRSDPPPRPPPGELVYWDGDPTHYLIVLDSDGEDCVEAVSTRTWRTMKFGPKSTFRKVDAQLVLV